MDKTELTAIERDENNRIAGTQYLMGVAEAFYERRLRALTPPLTEDQMSQCLVNVSQSALKSYEGELSALDDEQLTVIVGSIEQEELNRATYPNWPPISRTMQIFASMDPEKPAELRTGYSFGIEGTKSLFNVNVPTDRAWDSAVYPAVTEQWNNIRSTG